MQKQDAIQEEGRETSIINHEVAWACFSMLRYALQACQTGCKFDMLTLVFTVAKHTSLDFREFRNNAELCSLAQESKWIIN